MGIDETEALGNQESRNDCRLKRDQHAAQEYEDHQLLARKRVPQGEPRHGVDDDIRYYHDRGYEQAVPKIAQEGNPVVDVDVVKQIGILWNE